MAVIRPILRAQWLSMRMGATRRGRALSVLTGGIWYGVWLLIAIYLYRYLAEAPAAALRRDIPLALLGVCMYWQLMPVLSASMGSSLDLRKLRIYPVSHGKLFQVEVMLRLTTGVETLMALIAIVAALFRNPYTNGWYALPAVLIYIVFNLLLGAGTRSLLERMLSKRHVREALVFVMLMLLMVPRLVLLSGRQPEKLHGLDRVIRSVTWPWTAAAHAALDMNLLYALLYLTGWTCLAAWFGRSQFERSLRFDTVAAEATPLAGKSRLGTFLDAAYRLPSQFLRDPVAAIVEKELRSLARTPRYRVVFVMGFSFGLAVWLPLVMVGRVHPQSALSENFLTVVCVYALTLLGQVSYWNMFGFDRSAAQIYFIAPQPLRATFIGKNMAALMFIYLEVAILVAITSALRVRNTLPEIGDTLLVVGICALYMLSVGNIASVQYPRALNPSKVAHGGAGGRFQALVLLLYPLTLLPVGLAYLAGYAFDSGIAFYAVLAFDAVVGVVVYWIAMNSAVRTAIRRREEMVQELTGTDGPIAA